MRGKTTDLNVEKYRELKSQGLSRGAIAERLGLDPSAISKFVSRNREKLDQAGVDTTYGKQTANSGVALDAVEKLLKVNLVLSKQIEKTVKHLKESDFSAASIKPIELLIKLSGEYRQSLSALENLKSALNDQRIIFEFHRGLADIISRLVPKDLRDELFKEILALRNAFSETPEIKLTYGGK